MSYKIAKHILSGDNVEYRATRGKDSGAYADGLPDTIVIHYTAGSSLESSVSTLQDPKVKASAHLVVGRDSRIVQLIPFNKIAWHAGESEWGNRTWLNKYSIGIEIDNAGRLSKVGDKYQTWWGGFIDRDQVFEGVHRNETQPAYWHAFTEQQITAVIGICRILGEKYNITTIVGHEEISPGRKSDPGPAFPLDKLRQLLLEGRDDPEEEETVLPAEPVVHPSTTIGMVTANSLNFRSAPSLNADTRGAPLQKDTKIEIVDEQSGWYKVKVSKIGWVKKEYVKVVN